MDYCHNQVNKIQNYFCAFAKFICAYAQNYYVHKHKRRKKIKMGYGRGGGNRHRRMYYATGLPGWMRFGYSPGWIGRSPTGLPPTAQWLLSSGNLPQFQEYLQQMNPPGTIPMDPMSQNMPFTPTISKEQEVSMLNQQAEFLTQQLEQIKKRLQELVEE